MKLLYCHLCGDIFNLNFELKSCLCGEVKGKYLDKTNAVVNGKGHSMAMGNGSFGQACMAVWNMREDFRDKDPWARHPTSVICWVRPHEGPANSHTKVDPNL